MLRRLLKASIVVLLIVGLLLCTSSALALSIGVAPGKMEFSLHPGDTEVQTLHVINQETQKSEFQVYAEGGNEEWFKITPDEFALNAQEAKGVEIAVAPPLMITPGDHDLSICVVSVLPGSDLCIGAGVKVPTHVQITEFPVMAIQ
ncbi:unnamed protein product, partial [marine sediment metagenome]